MNIVDIACATTTREGGKVVREIEVEVGGMAGVMVDSLRFCFEAVTRDTMAAGATLKIVETPAAAECLECGEKFTLDAPWGQCPACNSPALAVQGGQELRVLSVTFD